MRIWTQVILAVALAGAAPALAAHYGVFRNPSGSVTVKLADCGDKLCGTIVSASDKARADAAEAGQHHLVGMQLFRNLVPTPGAPRHWTGEVYIPDKDTTVAGTATLNGRVLTVKGCLLGDALCKEQAWRRIR
jgi:uncharacterized protein (DUF2147 family)